MNKLSAKQEKAAILLAAGHNGREVAKTVSVAPETISQWKKNLIFEALINDIRYESLLAAREQMRSLCNEALGTIQELMKSSESDAVRLKACLEILKLSGIGDSDHFGWGLGSGNPLMLAREKTLEQMSIGWGASDDLSTTNFKAP